MSEWLLEEIMSNVLLNFYRLVGCTLARVIEITCVGKREKNTISQPASTGGHKPHLQANSPYLEPPTSIQCGHLPQVVHLPSRSLHYVCFTVVYSLEEVCSMGHQSSCRRDRPSGASAYWFYELWRLFYFYKVKLEKVLWPCNKSPTFDLRSSRNELHNVFFVLIA